MERLKQLIGARLSLAENKIYKRVRNLANRSFIDEVIQREFEEVYQYLAGELDKEEFLAEHDKDCDNCKAMKKVDNLADAIDQAVMISKEIKQPFKVSAVERECKDA